MDPPESGAPPARRGYSTLSIMNKTLSGKKMKIKSISLMALCTSSTSSSVPSLLSRNALGDQNAKPTGCHQQTLGHLLPLLLFKHPRTFNVIVSPYCAAVNSPLALFAANVDATLVSLRRRVDGTTHPSGLQLPKTSVSFGSSSRYARSSRVHFLPHFTKASLTDWSASLERLSLL